MRAILLCEKNSKKSDFSQMHGLNMQKLPVKKFFSFLERWSSHGHKEEKTSLMVKEVSRDINIFP